MFCDVIASWKLECKCKRLLWTECWYSKLFRLLWEFLNIIDVFDYLRFNFKAQDFVVRLSIKAQIRTQSETNLEKREVRSHNKVR